ncbi:ribosome production factor 2 homolog [Triticum dicoccoides]|uniref:ribosome production factor 2 homolog n=1 Tax=Triticum dicoccoides TaxID=85692 RepID=UPI00188EBA2A|nr:ribosome production factor 2 homolog [Triticum dicoccoides]
MRTPGHAKKVKNVTNDVIDGKRGMIYIPDQKISKLTLTKDIKGLKQERRDAKKNKGHSKKQKLRRRKKKLASKSAK